MRRLLVLAIVATVGSVALLPSASARPAAPHDVILFVPLDPQGRGGVGGTRETTTSTLRFTSLGGGVVTATVRVRVDGKAVRPTRVTCTGRIGALRVRGRPSAAPGRATCTYRTPASARGKTLTGTISLTARGKRFTKRFTVRLA